MCWSRSVPEIYYACRWDVKQPANHSLSLCCVALSDRTLWVTSAVSLSLCPWPKGQARQCNADLSLRYVVHVAGMSSRQHTTAYHSAVLHCRAGPYESPVLCVPSLMCPLSFSISLQDGIIVFGNVHARSDPSSAWTRMVPVLSGWNIPCPFLLPARPVFAMKSTPLCPWHFSPSGRSVLLNVQIYAGKILPWDEGSEDLSVFC